MFQTAVNSKVECGKRCVRNIECLSFNFCHSSYCILNSIDESDVRFADNLFHEKECSLHVMEISSQPACQQHGIRREIANVEEPNVCEISFKMVAETCEWVEKQISDKDELKNFKECETLTHAAHGGPVLNVEKTLILHWVKYFRIQKTWYGARDHCASLNGYLFDDISTSLEGLMDISSRLNGCSFWLGVYFHSNHYLWAKVSGGLLYTHQIPFMPHEPYNPYVEPFLMYIVDLNNPSRYMYNDAKAAALLCFVCVIHV